MAGRTRSPSPINDLADHAQVILHSQFWQVDASRTYGVSGTGLDWELDWTEPWEHLVEESRTWPLLEASEAPAGDNIFVAPTWIDERCDFVNDWTPPVILSFSIATYRSRSTPVTPRNGREATENERGNGQHRRTPILQARVVPDSHSDADRNDAVTAGVHRRVSCRSVIVG